MVRLGEVMGALNEAFPFELALEWDNSGLQVGDPGCEVSGALCAIDVTPETIRLAREAGCDLIVAHHPLIFRPLPSLDSRSFTGLLVSEALKQGVSVVACHTNADVAEGGSADILADRIGLLDARPLEPHPVAHYAKVVVFVPPEAVEKVSEAMAAAGAGKIGAYSHCGFRSAGTGTFIPLEGAEPYTGEKGVLNRVDEVRLEMRAPSFLVERVIRAMLRAHPYEEVAHDVYRTQNHVPWGTGRMGRLASPRAARDILGNLASFCGSPNPLLRGDPDKPVVMVAVVPGDGASLVPTAARAGVELMVTGEAGHHRLLEAEGLGVSVGCLGHRRSELPLVGRMAEVLERASSERGWELKVVKGERGGSLI